MGQALATLQGQMGRHLSPGKRAALAAQSWFRRRHSIYKLQNQRLYHRVLLAVCRANPSLKLLAQPQVDLEPQVTFGSIHPVSSEVSIDFPSDLVTAGGSRPFSTTTKAEEAIPS